MQAALAARLPAWSSIGRLLGTPALKGAFANLTKLPRSYTGERHVVTIAAQSGSGCIHQYEERPGAGTPIEREPGTLLVMSRRARTPPPSSVRYCALTPDDRCSSGWV